MRTYFTILLGTVLLASSAIAQRSVINNMRLKRSLPDTSNYNYVFTIPENEDYDYFVGAVNEPVSFFSDTLDNNLFSYRNDSLFTKYSFDYEGILGTAFSLLINTPSGDDTVIVLISDVTGKWDANGVADQDLAGKYDNVQVGDYIFWNYTNGQNLNTALPGVNFPNKILIHAKPYQRITLNLSNASGTDPNSRIAITNFLGQVESENGIRLDNLEYVRLTGEYNPAIGIGHRYFMGCSNNGSDIDFGFSHGTYGFLFNNNWTSTTYNGVEILTANNGVEIDHIEIGNGFFNGILWHWEDNYAISQNNYVHHNFIHDIGAEGMKIGAGGEFPQQVFLNTIVENNAVVRSGAEGIEIAWWMQGSKIRNNFIHGAVAWKDPFGRWQDNVLQISVVGGDIVIDNNVLIGAGDNVANIWTNPNTTPLSYGTDTLSISHNLIYRARGDLAFYSHNVTDGLTHILFDDNIFAQIGYDLEEVYTHADTSSTLLYGLNTPTISSIISNNVYDNSVEQLVQGGASTLLSNNQQANVPHPDFINYMGLGSNYNYLHVSRYTDFIGTSANFPANGTNKGAPASWEAGDVVQWQNSDGKTRFYECMVPEQTGSVNPPQDDTDNSTWKLLSWTKPNGSTSYFPPDDIRLTAGSYFDQKEIGVRDSISGDSTPPSENLLPVVAITNVDDNHSLHKATMLNIQATAYDPDGTVDSVRFTIDGHSLGWVFSTPFEVNYLADTTGTFTLRATAYDNSGDSLVSNGINIHITDDQFFRVLHYTETSGFDHGTRGSSETLLENLGLQLGFEVDNDQTGATFNSVANLQEYDVVIFSNTSGDQLLDATQRANFEVYMNSGGAFIGIHAASDSYRHSTANGSNTGTWDWFAEMLGASVQNTPNHTASNYNGTMDHVGTHPTTVNTPNPWNKTDEYYYWENGYYNTDNNTVLEVRSTGSQTYDAARPISWFKYLPGGGRSFYTALGHHISSFANDSSFIKHVRDAILWSVNNAPPLISVTSPGSNDTIVLGDPLNITADASDPDGTVDSVEFRVGDNTIAWDYAAPWEATYIGSQQGNYSLTAIAYDDEGAIAISSVIRFFVDDTIAGDTIILTGNTINENYPAGTFIGTLGGSNDYRINHEEYDGWFFMLKGDSLLSRMSFNYDAFINSNLSNSHPQIEIEDGSGNSEVFTITILPATGKYDQNGYADQDLVDHYAALGDSSLMVGDYIVFNWSNNSGWTSVSPTLSYPNQLKVMSGYYDQFVIDMNDAEGNSTKQPVIITNFGGQVEYRTELDLKNCKACRLTGEYNPAKRTGNKYFPGDVHAPWKYRTFGFHRDKKGLVTGHHGIEVTGVQMTKVEIDHVEIMGGHYDGINFKQDDAGPHIVDSNYIHDNYLHDLNNEGLYMGNTKGGNQQHFANTVVENNLFIRCGGEGYQFQRGVENNIYRNNVLWTGMVWLNPFQNWQFAGNQTKWADGGNVHRDEIIMGAVGHNSGQAQPFIGESLPYNNFSNEIKNTLYYNMRGEGFMYMNNGGAAGFPLTEIDSLYYGHTNLGYERISSTWNPNTNTIRALLVENWGSPINVGTIFYDYSFTTAAQGVNVSNPVQQVVPAPQFENAFGTDTGSLRVDSIHMWSHWYPVIWDDTQGGNGHRVGDPVIFRKGEVVQHWRVTGNRWAGNAAPVRLYYCIQQHNATTVEPGVTSGWESYWKLLTWEKPNGEITYYPPDDWDLVNGSYYDQRGLGLRGGAATGGSGTTNSGGSGGSGTGSGSSGGSGSGSTGGSGGSGGVSGSGNGATHHLSDLDQYFDLAYIPETFYEDENATIAITDSASVRFFTDNIQGSQFGDLGAEYIGSENPSIRFDDPPTYVEAQEGNYVFFGNTANLKYHTPDQGTDIPLPYSIYLVVRKLDAIKDEGFVDVAFRIRNRADNHMEVAIDFSAAGFPNGSGVFESNKITIVRFDADVNGNIKMWWNGQPYANGASVNVGYGGSRRWGYGTNSHIAQHDFFGHWVKFGTLTQTEHDSIYNVLSSIFAEGEYPPYPLAENFRTTFNSSTDTWTVDYDYVNTLAYPEDPAATKYQWYIRDGGFGASLESVYPIPGARSKTLKRADYPNLFPGNNPTNSHVYCGVKVYDTQGNTWRELHGDYIVDNVR